MRTPKILRIWGFPIAFAVSTIAALVVALVGPATWLWVAGLALCLPPAAGIWYSLGGRCGLACR